MNVYILAAYGALQLPRIATLIYHSHHPLQQDVFGQDISPSGRLALFMYRLEILVNVLLFFLFVLLFVSLSQGTKCPDLSSGLLVFFVQVAIVLLNILFYSLPFVLVLAFFLCLPCALILLRWLYPAPNRGVPEDELQKLPKYTYSTDPSRRDYGGATITQEDAACSICLQDYTDEAILRVLTCRHHFHQSCVDDWFRLQATCPLCVRSVISGDVGTIV